MADFSATSGEPIIKIDHKDQIFVTSPFGVSTTLSLLWRSSDGGRTFKAVGTPVLRDAVIGPGGGDTDMDFDDKGRLYYVDLSAACVTVGVSEDGGNTFSQERTNYVTCVSDKTMGAVDDRQWVAAFGDGTAYVTWRRFTGLSPLPFYMFKTSDAGLTWDKGRVLGNVAQSGPMRVDKQKRKVMVNGVEREAILLYQIYYVGNDIRVFRVTDFDDGTEPLVEDLRIFNGGSADISNVFPVLAVDRAGNLYATWSQNGTVIYMATSTDRGNSWSSPKQVSNLTGTNIMPWVVAGDPGRADIIWYRSNLVGNPNNPSSTWTIHMAQTLNAFDASPAFSTAQVSQNVIHRGEICLEGTLCDATPGRDRSFLEYPSIFMDSKGAAVITYNDNTNQSEGPYVMVAKQATGPSLIASVGNLGREPGAVNITQPAANGMVTTETFTLRGGHTVPPKNFDRDEAGDARFTPTGNNLPGADLRSVSIREEGDSFVLTMQVADLTPAAISNAASTAAGDGMLYLTQWDYNDTIYWLGAEVRNGQTKYHTGTLGIIKSATSKKFITYNSDPVRSLQVQGTMTNTTNGAINIRVPKSVVGAPLAGASFHTLTGYAFSQRGPLIPVGSNQAPSPTSLPIQLDAAAAVTYTVGEGGAAANGIVEVSMDDQTFSAPRQAGFVNDLGESQWELQLGAAELKPGTHTLYVRQRINGREASPVTSISFTVSDTIEQIITSMVALESRNARMASGVASFDLLIRNASSATIFTPLRAQVSQLSSASGAVSVANADSGGSGVGALWEYGSNVGADSVLSSGETSGARNLRFNNPNNEAFTVYFTVAGQLQRGTPGGVSATSGGSTSGQSSGGSASGTSSSSTPLSLSGIVSRVYKVTFNPLLNSATVELISR
jgi:hypothetical protein